MLRPLLITILTALLAACASGPRSAAPVVSSGGLLYAGAGAERVRADFDAQVGRVRFLAILSPT